MSWSTPKTWAAEELVGAEELRREMSDNQLALKYPPTVNFRLSSDISTTSTSFVYIDPDLNFDLTTNGGPVTVGFCPTFYLPSGQTAILFDVEIDGTRQGGSNGLWRFFVDASHAVHQAAPIFRTFWGLSAATHEINLMWASGNGNTIRILGGNDGTGSRAVRSRAWVREIN